MAKQTITYRGRMLTKVKGWSAAIKEAVGGSIVEWWKVRLPIHFTMQAYYRYGAGINRAGEGGLFKTRFEKLSAADRRAGKRAGARAPMVSSGTLMRSVLGIQPRIGGTQQAGFRGYLRGSNVANFHTGNNPQTGNYNMVAELRVVNPDEIDDMAEVVDLRLDGFLKAAGATEAKEL